MRSATNKDAALHGGRPPVCSRCFELLCRQLHGRLVWEGETAWVR